MVIWHLPGVLQHIWAILRCHWHPGDRYFSNGHTLYGLTPNFCVFDTMAAIQANDNGMWDTSHVYLTRTKFNM